jgi:glutathione peroxidase
MSFSVAQASRPVLMFSAFTLLAATVVWDYNLPSIDGKPVPLATYKGKVALIVNVASQCGYTPQYAGLEALYEKYKDQGLVVLGFPANNFGNQEPGTNDEIKQFCTRNYKVTFPMFAKVSVAGDDKTPLYQFLTGKESNEKAAGEIRWNFTKFLVGRDGKVIARFEPDVAPEDPELVTAVEAALKPEPAEPAKPLRASRL